MTPDQVIEYYGTQRKAAEALGVTQPAISTWLRKGRVPETRQYQIEVRTGGQLKAEPFQASP